MVVERAVCYLIYVGIWHRLLMGNLIYFPVQCGCKRGASRHPEAVWAVSPEDRSSLWLNINTPIHKP